MPLPLIENVTPDVVPAVAERNFNAMYMTLLVTRLLNDNTQNMRLEFRPYDSTANVVKEDGSVHVTIPDVFAKAATMPAFAEVLGAVTLVGNLLCKEQQLVDQIETTTEEEDPTDLQTELDALRVQIASTTLAELLSA